MVSLVFYFYFRDKGKESGEAGSFNQITFPKGIHQKSK